MENFIEIIKGIGLEIWYILNDSAPWLIFGFAVAATIKAFIPDHLISKHLGKPGTASVLKAALIGVPLPLCSCGVIPAAMGLRKQGASRGATSSFLISTPETGVDSIAISWALLDPVMTIFRPVAAFVTAFIAGVLENKLNREEDPVQVPKVPVTSCCATGCCGDNKEPEVVVPKKQSLGDRMRESFEYSFGDLLADIGKWLLIGIVIAGLIGYFVPDTFFSDYLGHGILPMLVMLVVGIPLYICATSSTPLAAAMILKGLSPGAALVFLLAGPATNASTIGIVWKSLGRKSLVIYLASIAVCALGFGYLLDLVYKWTGITMQPSIGSGDGESVNWFTITCAVVMVALIMRSLILEMQSKTRASSFVRYLGSQ